MNNENAPIDESDLLEQVDLKIKVRSDKRMEFSLLLYAAFGIWISIFHDTSTIGLTIGPACLLVYYIIKKACYKLNLHHYVASLTIGVFMMQFIYQMHGLFEMHFFVFIGSALLITYQNWKTQIPLAGIVIVHHTVFGYLQYASFLANEESNIYFTQLEYMDLQTFIFHVVLSFLVFFICGFWSYDMRRRTDQNTTSMIELAKISGDMSENLANTYSWSSGFYEEKVNVIEGGLMTKALNRIQELLTRN
jgi:hypothetical protein